MFSIYMYIYSSISYQKEIGMIQFIVFVKSKIWKKFFKKNIKKIFFEKNFEAPSYYAALLTGLDLTM